MRILHLLSQHPESTGSGFYIRNVISQSEAAGHENYLLAGTSNADQYTLKSLPPSSSSFVNFGSGNLDFAIPGMSDVMPYPSSRFSELTKQQLKNYETQWGEAISRAFDVFGPTLVHSHHLWIMSGIARTILPKIPMVTSCHSTDLRQFVQCSHLQKMVKERCSSIHRILALGRSQATKIEDLLAIPQSKIDIVGGGFDADLFRWQQKASAPPVELLYGGKLSYAKGVDWLLKTMESMGKHQVHLHLAGSGTGTEKQHCLELAARLGTRVTVYGQLSQEQLASLMAKCHIFILPSFYEGLPLVLLEALASGCRIITTNLPGCLELLKHVSPALVDLITLPPMATVDRPQENELVTLQKKLAVSINRMAEKVMNQESPSEPEVINVTSRFHWHQVFKRIEAAYTTAVAAAGSSECG